MKSKSKNKAQVPKKTPITKKPTMQQGGKKKY